jgi:23S rRNA pseudouridine1911/1915/1917 synthase
VKLLRNQGYAYRSIIGGVWAGHTLLEHLASVYTHSTRQTWQQRLEQGELLLEGAIATGNTVLRGGQQLVWNRPPWDEDDTPQEFEVVFEDEWLLAVNKPSGLPTIPGGGFLENTLLHRVRQHWPGVNPVHRLGRGTSGLVLFAKTGEVTSKLLRDWNTPGVEKIYRALAAGMAERDHYDIQTPIGLVPHPRLGSVWAADANGKQSRSVADVMDRSEGRTVFAISLHSGRPHQIRIHLASVGHPLVGDPLYGPGGKPLEHLPGLPGDGGYLLHAEILRFRHPVSQFQLQLSVPPQEALANSLSSV